MNSYGKPSQSNFGQLLKSLFLFIVLVIFGLLIGFVFLVSKYPEAERTQRTAQTEETEEISPFFQLDKEVTYHRKELAGFRWQMLRERLIAIANGQISLSAADLNDWSNNIFADIENQNIETPASAVVGLKMASPSAHIEPGQLNILIPIEIDIIGTAQKIAVQVGGRFEESSNGPILIANRLYLNSAPIPFSAAIFTALQPALIGLIADTDEFQKIQNIWPDIQRIEVGESTLIITKR